MLLTLMNALCLIALGLAGFIGWDRLGATSGEPIEMLMPVFFGGALLICVAFSRQHFRHGLYGGLIVALLGAVSAIYRLYQYGALQGLFDSRSKLILAMGALCLMQMIVSWRDVQKDRNNVSPPI